MVSGVADNAVLVAVIVLPRRVVLVGRTCKIQTVGSKCEIIRVVVVGIRERLLQTVFRKRDTADDSGGFRTDDVVVRHERTEFIVTHYNACVVEQLQTVKITVGVGNVGNFGNVILGSKIVVRYGFREDNCHFIALDGAFVIVERVGFDNAVVDGVFYIVIVPVGAVLRESGAFCIVRVVNACGDGDGFGNCHVALRRKDAVCRALHEAELIRGRDGGSVPFACRNIVEHSGRVGVGFSKTGGGGG